MTPPRQCPISASPRDTPGPDAWRRTTSAANQQSWPARAVVCPAGANIVRSPVSLRSTVAPRAQPRSVRPLQCCPNPTNFAKNSKITAQKGAKPLDSFVIIVLAVSLLDCQNHKHLNRGTQLWLKTKPRSTFSPAFSVLARPPLSKSSSKRRSRAKRSS